MSVSPLERIAPALAALTGGERAPAAEAATGERTSFRPLLGVLTVFWVYVALSNVMYANNMQASLSSMSMERVFARWDARLVQHLHRLRLDAAALAQPLQLAQASVLEAQLVVL